MAGRDKVVYGLLGVVALLILGVLATGSSSSPPPSRPAPALFGNYTVVERWDMGQAIVIPPSRATMADLRLLAEQLRQEVRRGNSTHHFAFVFTNAQAAANRKANHEKLSAAANQQYDTAFVMTYVRNTTSGTDRATISPLGIRHPGVRIDYLPGGGTKEERVSAW